MQPILHLHLIATIANINKSVNGKRKISKMKRASKAVDSDAHRSFDDILDPFVLDEIVRIGDEVCIQPSNLE